LAVQKDSTLLRHLEEIRGGDQLAVDTLRRKVMASGVCDRVLSRALSQTSRAIEHLNQLPPSPARSLLISVAQQLADRSH
jgi:geranylgeranyl pyrophosphate synthase